MLRIIVEGDDFERRSLVGRGLTGLLLGFGVDDADVVVRGVCDESGGSGRLVFDPNVSLDSPVVAGTWVTVTHIVSLVTEGWTWSDILKTHPELSEDDIREALVYCAAEDEAVCHRHCGGCAPILQRSDGGPTFCGTATVHSGRCLLGEDGEEICSECGDPFDNDSVTDPRGGISLPEHAVHLLRSQGFTKESAWDFVGCPSVLAGRSIEEALGEGRGEAVRKLIEALGELSCV